MLYFRKAGSSRISNMTRPGQRREESNLADLILELAFFLLLISIHNGSMNLARNWPGVVAIGANQEICTNSCQSVQVVSAFCIALLIAQCSGLCSWKLVLAAVIIQKCRTMSPVNLYFSLVFALHGSSNQTKRWNHQFSICLSGFPPK